MDKSLDTSDAPQLIITIRMSVQAYTAAEQTLTVLRLIGRARWEDIYEAFKGFISTADMPRKKSPPITVYEDSDMIDSKNVFIAQWRNDETLPKFNSYHFVIHLEVRCAKLFQLRIFGIQWQKSQTPLQQRHCNVGFQTISRGYRSEYSDLISYMKVKWYGTGTVPESFINVTDKVRALH
jgi:hypothetical protein